MITRLLNVALNQFSNMSVPAARSRRGGGASRDSEFDSAMGEMMGLLRKRCCYSWLLRVFLEVNIPPFFNKFYRNKPNNVLSYLNNFKVHYYQVICSQNQP